MESGVSARRRTVVSLFIALGLVAVSCSDHESPTSPRSSPAEDRATTSGATRGGVTASRGRSPVTVNPRSRGNTGIITGLSATSFTIQTPKGALTIQTNASTVFRLRGKAATFADLKIGLRVEVEGPAQPDGSILAARVEDEDDENEQEEATKSPTPTVTGTPPTATPTRTPKPEDDEDNEKTKTPTFTPGGPTRTPTVTRTPEQENEEENERTKTPTFTPGGPTRTPTPTRTPEQDND